MAIISNNNSSDNRQRKLIDSLKIEIDSKILDLGKTHLKIRYLKYAAAQLPLHIDSNEQTCTSFFSRGNAKYFGHKRFIVDTQNVSLQFYN